jgi:putative ATPase
MLESGEDPLYIARRIVRFASEDVGLADPAALSLAVSAMQAFHFIGLPEGTLALAEAAVYMATAPKSNAIYKAYESALQDIKMTLADPVPLHLRNAPTSLMKDLGYGRGYKYAHQFSERVTDMNCLPPSLAGKTYFAPSGEGYEATVSERLKEWRSKVKQDREKAEKK